MKAIRYFYRSTEQCWLCSLTVRTVTTQELLVKSKYLLQQSSSKVYMYHNTGSFPTFTLPIQDNIAQATCQQCPRKHSKGFNFQDTALCRLVFEELPAADGRTTPGGADNNLQHCSAAPWIKKLAPGTMAKPVWIWHIHKSSLSESKEQKECYLSNFNNAPVME